jgi:hypothetical protein
MYQATERVRHRVWAICEFTGRAGVGVAVVTENDNGLISGVAETATGKYTVTFKDKWSKIVGDVTVEGANNIGGKIITRDVSLANPTLNLHIATHDNGTVSDAVGSAIRVRLCLTR